MLEMLDAVFALGTIVLVMSTVPEALGWFGSAALIAGAILAVWMGRRPGFLRLMDNSAHLDVETRAEEGASMSRRPLAAVALFLAGLTIGVMVGAVMNRWNLVFSIWSLLR